MVDGHEIHHSKGMTLVRWGEVAFPENVRLLRSLSGHIHQLWPLFFGLGPPLLIQALLFEAMSGGPRAEIWLIERWPYIGELDPIP